MHQPEHSCNRRRKHRGVAPMAVSLGALVVLPRVELLGAARGTLSICLFRRNPRNVPRCPTICRVWHIAVAPGGVSNASHGKYHWMPWGVPLDLLDNSAPPERLVLSRCSFWQTLKSKPFLSRAWLLPRAALLAMCLDQVEEKFDLYLQHDNGNSLVYDEVQQTANSGQFPPTYAGG